MDDLRAREALSQWRKATRELNALEARRFDALRERAWVMEREIADQQMHRDSIHRSVIAEFAAAAHLTHGVVEAMLGDSLALERLPRTDHAFTQGSVSRRHVQVIVAEMPRPDTAGLSREDAERMVRETLLAYDTEVAAFAVDSTPTRTQAFARGVAAALCPKDVVQRHREAREDREVTIMPTGDGMACLKAVLPEIIAIAIYDRLTVYAREQKRHAQKNTAQENTVQTDAQKRWSADSIDHTVDEVAPGESAPGESASGAAALDEVAPDERTMDQRRADVLADLLLTTDPTTTQGTVFESIQARVQVTIAATTLAGIDDNPAELDGVGPIDPDIARALAGHAPSWDRLFLDGAGMVTETDSYTPTQSMKRYLRARDGHCRFPGCRAQVHRCQIDHTKDHAKGGPTHVGNLSHLCPRHHVLKHPDIPDRYRWEVLSLPGGTLQWCSPTGNTYHDRPPHRVMFV